jgi:hypothetical protein
MTLRVAGDAPDEIVALQVPEDVHDILRPMDQQDSWEVGELLRYQWVGGCQPKQINEDMPLDEAFIDKDKQPEKHAHGPSHIFSGGYNRRSCFCGGRDLASITAVLGKKASARQKTKGIENKKQGSKRQGNKAAHGGKQSIGKRVTISGALSKCISSALAKIVSEDHKEKECRKWDRDQRTEMRKMQQTLLSSGQQAFDDETWQGCGIESEHLKRHQFAALLGQSLSLFGQKEEVHEEASAATAS